MKNSPPTIWAAASLTDKVLLVLLMLVIGLATFEGNYEKAIFFGLLLHWNIERIRR